MTLPPGAGGDARRAPVGWARLVDEARDEASGGGAPSREREGATDAGPAPPGTAPAPQGPDAPAVRVFLVLFSAYVATRGWRAESVLSALMGLAMFFGPLRRWAALVAFAHYLTPGVGRLATAPFLAGNHEYLEALFLLIVALEPGRDGPGRVLLRRTLVAVAVALVFLSGVQKVVHRSYVRGDFFTQCYAEPTKFSKLFNALVSDEERETAVAYRADLAFFVREVREGVLDEAPPRPARIVWISRVLCWGTLAGELLLPWMLLARGARRRKVGAALLIAFFAAVEAVAREWTFGWLVLCLLVPFFFERDAGGASPEPSLRSRPGLRAVAVLVWTWPFAHMYLALAHDLSPWKLAGFGMYSIPGRMGSLALEIRHGEREYRPRTPRDRQEAERYEETAYALRNVPFSSAPARELAHAVQERTPEGVARPDVRIRVTTIRLDRELDRYRATMRTWTYDESGKRVLP